MPSDSESRSQLARGSARVISHHCFHTARCESVVVERTTSAANVCSRHKAFSHLLNHSFIHITIHYPLPHPLPSVTVSLLLTHTVRLSQLSSAERCTPHCSQLASIHPASRSARRESSQRRAVDLLSIDQPLPAQHTHHVILPLCYCSDTAT